MSPLITTSPSPEGVLRQYTKLRPTYKKFTEQIRQLLEELVQEADIKTHAFESRAKTVDSLRGKISTKRYMMELRQFTDLAGVRIIVYYHEDVEKVASVIDAEFVVDREASSDTVERLEPQEFGYRSRHLVVSLHPDRSKLTKWRSYESFQCEIQIRTVLEHAWAAVSHALQYKREGQVPKALSRRLFLLSGLLELGDREFSSLRTAHQNIERDLAAATDEVLASTDINKFSAAEWLKRSDLPGEVAGLAQELGFDVKHEDKEFGLGLAASASAAGIASIGELVAALHEVKSLWRSFLTELAIDTWTGSVEFLLETLIILARADRFSPDALFDLEWSDWAAHVVLSAAQTATKDRMGQDV